MNDDTEMVWVADEVSETRKQLENLKQLLLKDITDDEKVKLKLLRPSCNALTLL